MEREIDRAPEFGDQWLEAPPLRRLQAIEPRQYVLVHFFGVRHQASRVGGTGFHQVDQAEADLDIGFHQLDANPVVRGSSVTARHTGPYYFTDARQ